MRSNDSEEFVSEKITPVPGTSDVSAMVRGEPGLPGRFCWRGVEYHVVGVIEKWKSSGRDRGGGKEMYLRRHWYRVLTRPHAIMTVYCDRQAKDRKRPKARWWLFSVSKVDRVE